MPSMITKIGFNQPRICRFPRYCHIDTASAVYYFSMIKYNQLEKKKKKNNLTHHWAISKSTTISKCQNVTDKCEIGSLLMARLKCLWHETKKKKKRRGANTVLFESIRLSPVPSQVTCGKKSFKINAKTKLWHT